MSVSGIGAYSNMSLTDILTGKKETENSTESLLGTSSQNTSLSSMSNYMLNNSEELQAVFDEIAKASGGKVTFTAVKEYQDLLQSQFNQAVKEDLAAMGVDPSVEFTLASDGNGGVKVLSDHADKEKIEAYFAMNEEMVGAFNRLQTLSNLDKARKEQGMSMENLSTRTAIDGLAQWWSAEGTEYSQYMYFSDTANLQFLGIGSTV